MTPGLAEKYPLSWTQPTNGHSREGNASSTPCHSDTSDSNINGFTRSASSTQLGSISETNGTPRDNLRRTLSENVLIESQGNPPDSWYRRTVDNLAHVQGAANGGEPELKQATPSDLKTKITVSHFTLDPPGATEEELLESHGTRKTRLPVKDDKTSTISRSLSRFARRSWVSRSRSSSPSPVVLDLKHKGEASSSTSTSLPSSALNTSADSAIADRPSKGRRRPLSTMMGRVPSDPSVPSVPAIPTSYSTDKLSLTLDQLSGQDPPVPSLTSWEPSHGTGADSPRKRDDLSSAFRTLDGDFQKHVTPAPGRLCFTNISVTKFQSRTSSLKTAVVRSALLPFLRTYAKHPSNTRLRTEDLDRRINTLNKWWVGLLSMLIGRNGESVSGSDRPTILDAVTSIMVRPEWTLPYQAIYSRSDRNARPSLKSRSTTSLASESSQFLTESISHNVKNLYAQNLLSQMAYVVEKMSSRSVPASVVTFCGKATAYAFFYCDGIAEILVRLWATPHETIRRVLAEHQLPRDANLKSSMNIVVPSFPSGLHGLGFQSVKATVQHLRLQPHFPIGAARINWYGPWVRRWAGRDTDLFFIFTRSYYNLMYGCLPPGLMSQGRLCAPGYILLQAQVLSNLDTIIQRSNNQSPLEPAFASSFQYNELFGEADASAPILPLSPTATNRSMAENRLIILLRDYLSGSTSLSEEAKQMFAESFESLLKAAVRRVSVFNYNACFTLCDFMEEALAILKIVQTLARRLDYVWSTFLYLQDDTLSKGGPRLSTAPCSPAPSRQLHIIRNDSQPSPGGMFLTFDSILSLPSSTQSTAYERHGSLRTMTGTKELSASKKTPSMGKKSWSVLKNIMPFTTSAMDSAPSNTGQDSMKVTSSNKQTPSDPSRASSQNSTGRQESPVFRARSFKFSLEWIGDETSAFGKERQLYRPRPPVSPSNRLEPLEVSVMDDNVYKARGAAINVGKYTGRALAEWDLLLAEFDEFFERRRTEGVPNPSQTETPTLGVETFRRPG
ncbi:MAG: hypothetical protein Q9172_002883 [Xanthocarpia lactea]